MVQTHLNLRRLMKLHALKLAQEGLKVFPLTAAGGPCANCTDCYAQCRTAEDYEVCGCLTCHACYAGTVEPERIRQMFPTGSHHLIAIRTGAASGIVVLDADMHAGGANGLEALWTLKRAGKLPQTVTAATGGGGLHLYYKHPGVPVANDNRGKLGAGIDVKGDGGYVIAPPSRKPGRQTYRWWEERSPWEHELAELPTDLLALIVAKPREPRRVRPGTLDVNLSLLIERDLEHALERLRWCGVGGRNAALYEAACRAGEAVAAGVLDVHTARDRVEDVGVEAQLHSHEIKNTIRSGMNRGMQSYLSEIARAKENNNGSAK